MDRAQLFKRLHTLTIHELKEFMQPSTPIRDSFRRFDLAAATRHIIGNIQFEDLWLADDGNGIFLVHIEFRLSPDALAANLEFNTDMNGLQWHFVFPKPEDIEAELKPQTFGDYLDQLVRVDIEDINDIDIDQACTFLELVFDFEPYKTPPPKLND
jgi:hypothetical protein